MEEIVAELYNNALDSKDVIEWLMNPQTLSEIFGHMSRFDFIKEFLHFIHNNTDCFIGPHDSFMITPIKLKLNQTTKPLQTPYLQSDSTIIELCSSTPINKSGNLPMNLINLDKISEVLSLDFNIKHPESFKRLNSTSDQNSSASNNNESPAYEPSSFFLREKSLLNKRLTDQDLDLNVPELVILNSCQFSTNNSNKLTINDAVIKRKKTVFKDFFLESNLAPTSNNSLNFKKNADNDIFDGKVYNRNISKENRLPNYRRVTTHSLNINSPNDFPTLSSKKIDEKPKTSICDQMATTNVTESVNSKNTSIDNSVYISAKTKGTLRHMPKDIFENRSKIEREMSPINLTTTNSILTYIVNIKNIYKPSSICHLSHIYSYLFLSGFISNIYSELFWLNQLLITNNQSDGSKYFLSIDDVSYFSANVLFNISKKFEYFELKMFKNLMKNIRLNYLKPEFTILMSSHIEHIESEHVESSSNLSTSFRANVPFQLEIDNRRNFPDDQSFHLFKRQRDIFYDLLREWEDNESTADWSIKLKMADRIKLLMASFDMYLVNRLHFIQLFIDQFIKTYFLLNNVSFLDDSIFNLNSSDSKKIEKLSGRLITPNTNQLNLNFPILPEFFLQFINLSSNYEFCTLLCQSLYQKIIEMERDVSYREDIDVSMRSNENVKAENKNISDSRNHILNSDKFVKCILTLRILGKLFGYVYFMPYKSKNIISQLDEGIYLSIRNKIIPPFDILLNLKNQLKSGSIFFILMWVLDFLSCADAYSLKLKYYTDLLEVLVKCYRHCFHLNWNSSAAFILIVMLSSFFEQYVNVDNLLWAVIDSNELNSKFSIDSLLNIESGVAMKICPAISDLNKIFIPHKSLVTQKNKTSSHRKIATKFIPNANISNGINSNENIQLQLRDAFLNRQSQLTKKCIELTSDSLSTQVIANLKDKHLDKVMKECHNYANSEVDYLLSDQREQRQLLSNFDSKAKELNETVLSIVVKLNKEFMIPHINCILPILLSKELSPKVVNILMTMCLNGCNQRISEWLSRYANIGILKKEMLGILNKKLLQITKTSNTFSEKKASDSKSDSWPKFNNNPFFSSNTRNGEKNRTIIKNIDRPIELIDANNDVNLSDNIKQYCNGSKYDDDDIWLPSNIMIMMKKIMCQLITDYTVTLDNVICAIQDLQIILKNRKDLLKSVKQNLVTMSIRFAFLLINNDNLWDNNIETLFIDTWTQFNDYNDKLNLSFSEQIHQQIHFSKRNSVLHKDILIKEFINNLKKKLLL